MSEFNEGVSLAQRPLGKMQKLHELFFWFASPTLRQDLLEYSPLIYEFGWSTHIVHEVETLV